MALVRVCRDAYVNTDAVGAVEVDQEFDEEAKTRSTTTRVLDLTGQNVLMEILTTVSTVIPNSNENEVKRDNFIHEEVLAALRESRDARDWVAP